MELEQNAIKKPFLLVVSGFFKVYFPSFLQSNSLLTLTKRSSSSLVNYLQPWRARQQLQRSDNEMTPRKYHLNFILIFILELESQLFGFNPPVVRDVYVRLCSLPSVIYTRKKDLKCYCICSLILFSYRIQKYNPLKLIFNWFLFPTK